MGREKSALQGTIEGKGALLHWRETTWLSRGKKNEPHCTIEIKVGEVKKKKIGGELVALTRGFETPTWGGGRLVKAADAPRCQGQPKGGERPSSNVTKTERQTKLRHNSNASKPKKKESKLYAKGRLRVITTHEGF